MSAKLYIKLVIAFYVITAVPLLVLPVSLFPEFYDVRYMGLQSLGSAAAVLLIIWWLSRSHVEPDRVHYFPALVATVLFLDGLGNLGLYQLYKVGFEYDKFLHFVSPLLMVIGLTHLLSAHFGRTFGRSLTISVLTVAGFGFGWELFEYTSDKVLGTRVFGLYGTDIYRDTIRDIIFNTLGALTGALYMSFWHSRNDKSGNFNSR